MATTGKSKTEKTCSFDEKDEHINNFALLVEDKKLYVNKAILANVSPVFYAMFFSDFKESKAEEIAIKDVKYSDMRLLLKAVYQYIEIQGKHVTTLLELADRFDIQCVIRQCERALIDSCVHSGEKKLIYADRFGFSELLESVLESLTIADMRRIAVENSKFGADTLRELLKHSVSFFNEPSRDWGRHGYCSRRGESPRLGRSPSRRDRDDSDYRRNDVPARRNREEVDLDEEPYLPPNREHDYIRDAIDYRRNEEPPARRDRGRRGYRWNDDPIVRTDRDNGLPWE